MAIIGVGGTGSYILDLIAKTSVKEIHLFDGDTFDSHNAFRSPGIATLDEVNQREFKTVFFKVVTSNSVKELSATHIGSPLTIWLN